MRDTSNLTIFSKCDITKKTTGTINTVYRKGVPNPWTLLVVHTPDGKSNQSRTEARFDGRHTLVRRINAQEL